jgi:hypothetical protein
MSIIEPDYIGSLYSEQNDFKNFARLNVYIQKLKKVIKVNDVLIWLATPNEAFDNKLPYDMIIEGNTNPIDKMIEEVQ